MSEQVLQYQSHNISVQLQFRTQSDFIASIYNILQTDPRIQSTSTMGCTETYLGIYPSSDIEENLSYLHTNLDTTQALKHPQ